MYLFLRVAGEDDSVCLAMRLIEEVGLGLAPGRAFGPEGEGWLRWCYAAEWKKNEYGIERLFTILIQVNFRRREAMHTIEVLALGLVLLGGFVYIGRALGKWIEEQYMNSLDRIIRLFGDQGRLSLAYCSGDKRRYTPPSPFAIA